MDLKPVFAAGALFGALACGTGPEGPTLGQRLQGHWVREDSIPDAGFLRIEYVSMSVYRTTLHYTYNVAWECGEGSACPGEPPGAEGGYFEGIFEDRGNTLVLKDGFEPVSFRLLSDSVLLFTVGGRAFELDRRKPATAPSPASLRTPSLPGPRAASGPPRPHASRESPLPVPPFPRPGPVSDR